MSIQSLEAVTRQIQQSTDIVDLISRDVKLSRAGREFRGLCPFHREKTPSFFVSPAKQIFQCFGCNRGGDVFKYIQLRENVSFAESRRILADRANIRIEVGRSKVTRSGPERTDVARVNDWAARWFSRQFESSAAGRAARDYAVRRGLSDASIEQWGLGFAPPSWDEFVHAAMAQHIDLNALAAAGIIKQRSDGDYFCVFRNRLMFPIRDTMDRVIGFGGRALGDEDVKYLNTSQTLLFDKGRALFGLDRAKNEISHRGAALVVEGYMDCLMAHQYGFGHAVATLGTALTEQHAEILSRYTDSIVLLFDSDEAGRRAADRALPVFLSQRLNVRMAEIPKGKDPCDYLTTDGAEAFEALLNSGCDALEFRWRDVARRFGGAVGGPERLRAINDFLDLIARAIDVGSMDPIKRGLVINQIAGLLGIERTEVHQRLLTAARRSGVEVSQNDAPDDAAAILPPCRDPLASATRSLLEVLINEPGFYALAADHFLPDRLPQPMRQVALAVAQLCVELGEFTLAELLARLEDVDAARCAVVLHAAGQKAGNFAVAVDCALARLRIESERARIAEMRSRLGVLSSADEFASAARDYTTAARSDSHFVPRRILRTRAAPPPGP